MGLNIGQQYKAYCYPQSTGYRAQTTFPTALGENTGGTRTTHARIWRHRGSPTMYYLQLEVFISPEGNQGGGFGARLTPADSNAEIALLSPAALLPTEPYEFRLILAENREVYVAKVDADYMGEPCTVGTARSESISLMIPISIDYQKSDTGYISDQVFNPIDESTNYYLNNVLVPDGEGTKIEDLQGSMELASLYLVEAVIPDPTYRGSSGALGVFNVEEVEVRPGENRVENTATQSELDDTAILEPEPSLFIVRGTLSRERSRSIEGIDGTWSLSGDKDYTLVSYREAGVNTGVVELQRELSFHID